MLWYSLIYKLHSAFQALLWIYSELKRRTSIRIFKHLLPCLLLSLFGTVLCVHMNKPFSVPFYFIVLDIKNASSLLLSILYSPTIRGHWDRLNDPAGMKRKKMSHTPTSTDCKNTEERKRGLITLLSIFRSCTCIKYFSSIFCQLSTHTCFHMENVFGALVWILHVFNVCFTEPLGSFSGTQQTGAILWWRVVISDRMPSDVLSDVKWGF